MKTYSPNHRKTMLLLKAIGVIILCMFSLFYQGFAQVERERHPEAEPPQAENPEVTLTGDHPTGMTIGEEAKNTQKETLKHVKIEIDHRGLHCPFLGIALKDKLKNTEGFKDFYIDKDDRFLTFTYPAEMPITHEELMKIPIGIGFSESIVHVAIADKPFKIDDLRMTNDE